MCSVSRIHLQSLSIRTLKMLFMLFKIHSFIYIIVLLLPNTGRSADPGFDLFFASNLREVEKAHIPFDKPLPKWLHGTLIRNGFGRFELGDRSFTHSFDAFAKLSSWNFTGNGSAFFSTKFIKTDVYQASIASKTIAPYLLFESVSPPFNEFEKVEALLHGLDNMNVNIYRYANVDRNDYQYFALNDFWKIYEIDPISLDTVKSVSAPLPKNVPIDRISFLSSLSSAHPLPEYGTANHITFVSSVSVDPLEKSKISLIRIKSAEEREVIAQVKIEKVPYMHSFSLTRNYAILFASPFYVNVGKMVLYAEPFNCLDWHPDEPTIVYVIELRTGKVLTLKTNTVFTMHHINAFEAEGSQLIVDISAYRSPDFVRNLQIKILRDPFKRNNFDAHAMLQRYHIDLNSKTVKMTPIEKSKEVPYATFLDLPTINEHYRYQNYCYIYGIVLKSDNITLGSIALVKKDLCNKTGDRVWLVKNHYPVEGWFVPTPGGLAEDDGYIMVPVLDGIKKKSYLSIIDAKSMTTTSTGVLPTIVPFNLHGRFFDNL